MSDPKEDKDDSVDESKRPKEEKDDFVDESKRLTDQFKKIGNRAIQKAREENRRLGIPNAVSRDGEIEYEMPDGEVTTENPFEETEEDIAGDSE